MPHMDQPQIRALAIREMRKWGLFEGARPWTFAFNTSKRALGICKFRVRTICISTHFIGKVSDAVLLDTIRHEIAHALDFVRYGSSSHDRRWKAIAVEVGADPKRVFDGEIAHAYTYVLKYDDKVVGGYYKLPTNILAKLPTLGIKGRPETRGKLKLFRVKY